MLTWRPVRDVGCRTSAMRAMTASWRYSPTVCSRRSCVTAQMMLLTQSSLRRRAASPTSSPVMTITSRWQFSAARSESCARRCGHAVHFGHEANDPVRFVQHRCECAAKQRAAARRRSTSSLTLPRSNTRITCKCELALVNNCVGFRTTSLFSCFEISWLRS
jgi:hypothetical protein